MENESEWRFIDESTKRKSQLLKDNIKYIDGYPVFSLVELNIFGNCNRNCEFCPVSNPEIYERINSGISVELYRKILNDLADINYSGKILFSAFSEPMLHKEIYTLISLTKEILPNVRLEIVTNGDVVKNRPAMITKLFESGLDTASFSLYDGPEQMEFFKNMRADLNLSESQMILRRRYFENGNYGMTISNRAGLIDSNNYRDQNEEQIENEELPLKRNCFYPFYQMLIDYNGDMILCPHDWEKKYKIGNVEKTHIFDLWKNNKFDAARNMLAKKNRCFGPCHSCDVKGDVMGHENFEAWAQAVKQ